MTPAAISYVLSAIMTAALVSAFANGLASAQGHWDHTEELRGSLFGPDQAGTGATQSLGKKNRSQRSRSITRPDVQKGLSLSDDQ